MLRCEDDSHSINRTNRDMKHRWKRPVPPLETTPDAAEAMVRAAVPGARVVQIKRIEAGLANTNVRVMLDREPGVVLLRLYQRDPKQAEKEAAISRRLSSIVPVPRYLHIGVDGEGRRFALV